MGDGGRRRRRRAERGDDRPCAGRAGWSPSTATRRRSPLATELGAEHTLLADGADVPARVAELTGGGSHVAVDAVGSEQTCADAILSLRRRGRHVQVGLLPPVDGHPRVPMARVIGWELDLLGSHGMAAADYPAMLDLIEQGALRPDLLVERTIGLEEAARLLPVLRPGHGRRHHCRRPSAPASF